MSVPPSLTLEITDGISEHANRVALKGVFTAFGDVLACWVPPIDRRGIDNGSVRFATAESAEAAKTACDGGQVFFQGIPLKVKWRVGGGPRVGNSDIGGAVNNRSPSPERDKWTRGANNRPERRRSPKRERRRSKSRDRRRRSRSREKKMREQDKFGTGPEAPSAAVPPPGPRPPDYSQLMAMGMGMAHSGVPMGIPGLPAVPAYSPELAAAEVQAEHRRKLDTLKKREAQMKRGPGVAALVHGALKKAQSLAQEKEQARERDQDDEEVSIVDDKRRRRESSQERTARERKEKREREEQEARAAQEERDRLDREAKEKQEKARQRAEEKQRAEAEAADRARREEDTREARVKAALEAAKRQQAEREKRAAENDNLYGDMPEPDREQESALKNKAAAAASNMNLGLPVEDPSKVIFLDVDGVLRPARAGGFDIALAEAVHPDTSDFFPSAMKALRHIVERTGAIIVLSSEWRRNESMCAAMDEKLTSSRLRISSANTRVDTPQDLGSGDPLRSFAERRAFEISSWIRQHEKEVKGWVVLDDMNLAIADENRKSNNMTMGPKLVQTWPLSGLTMGNAKKAVRILNGEMIQKVLVERPKAPENAGGDTKGTVGGSKS